MKPLCCVGERKIYVYHYLCCFSINKGISTIQATITVHCRCNAHMNKHKTFFQSQMYRRVQKGYRSTGRGTLAANLQHTSCEVILNTGWQTWCLASYSSMSEWRPTVYKQLWSWNKNVKTSIAHDSVYVCVRCNVSIHDIASTNWQSAHGTQQSDRRMAVCLWCTSVDKFLHINVHNTDNVAHYTWQDVMPQDFSSSCMYKMAITIVTGYMV